MQFEFLPAFQGDCFLIHAGSTAEPFLILVDGGPAGTYSQHLKPRLMELREERQLDELEPLSIDLLIVSHVDDDHINGIIDLLQEIHEAKTQNQVPLFEVRELWHNSFDAIIGNDDGEEGAAFAGAAQFGAASFAPLVAEAEDGTERDAALILQSVAQGHDLRNLAHELGIPLNDGRGGLLQAIEGEVTRVERGGIALTVLGPRPKQLDRLRKQHRDWLRRRAEEGQPVAPVSVLQALSADRSVPNLSSIVLLAERTGKRALLTGDAHSKFILQAMEEAGLLEAGESFPVDLLKMPHHGSDRNVDAAFLERVPATTYLFSGNGEHGNPERGTFEMLFRARPDSPMTLNITYPLSEIDHQRRIEHEEARRREEVKQRLGKLMPGREPREPWDDAEHSLAELAEELPAGVTLAVIDKGFDL